MMRCLTSSSTAFAGFWRFVFSWLLYSSVTGWYLYRCSSKQLDKTVPKQVCKIAAFTPPELQ